MFIPKVHKQAMYSTAMKIFFSLGNLSFVRIVFFLQIPSVISPLFVTVVVKHCSDSCYGRPLYTVLPC